jgi:hypothetical protein
LTKNEHDNFVSQDNDEDLVEEEFKDYQRAYLNAMMDFQKQYNLRSRNVAVDPFKKTPEGKTSAGHPAKNLLRREVVQ